MVAFNPYQSAIQDDSLNGVLNGCAFEIFKDNGFKLGPGNTTKDYKNWLVLSTKRESSQR